MALAVIFGVEHPVAAGLVFVVLGILQSGTYGWITASQNFTIGNTVVIPQGGISPVWLFVGIPLSLGSWWSIGLIVLVVPVLLWRLLDEERILDRDLRGYTEYKQRVPYHLIPGVW